MSAKTKTKTSGVTLRQRVISGISFHRYRLTVRFEKTDDVRLLSLTVGMGQLAGLARQPEIENERELLQRLAAHCAGWVEILDPKQADVFALINRERERQDKLFVEGRHQFSCAARGGDPKRKLRALVEEVGEVAEQIDIIERIPAQRAARTKHLIEELIQVAAVCVAWLESLEAA